MVLTSPGEGSPQAYPCVLSIIVKEFWTGNFVQESMSVTEWPRNELER